MKIYIVILSLIVLSGCRSSKSTNQDNKEVSYDMLLQANAHTLDFPEITIINSKDELYKNYSELNKTQMPGLPVPEVDFSKETVIIFSYHIENKKSNDLEIEKVSTTNNNTLELSITEFLNPGQPNDRIFKHPFFIMKVQGKYSDVKIIRE
ncbi:hypothetical protein [Mesonia maritima]|uniref:Lipoprotein n=1 Tax=Mesonia maritima TaxID=1793873 RepID=A0ABU1K905_9FLAO|nr:hypothetical protein [Mesonia maritima]MDR6302086.1 hypothetical protein [Mesonia maritima]